MLIIFILLTLAAVVFSGITTIPFSIGLLTVAAVLSKKSWVFFLALGLGLFLDLISIRPLGYTGLVLMIFVFIVFLYERKFETQTITFIFSAVFIGSLIYLKIFDYQQIFLQSAINSLLAILFFKFLWLKLGLRSETI